MQTDQEANGRAPTPLEIRRLADLIERFESAACQAQPASSGAAWVLAAIVEAVDSGSSFVAPRRIATICERWTREPRSSRKSGVGSRGERVTRSREEAAVEWPSEEMAVGASDPGVESEDALAPDPSTPDPRLPTAPLYPAPSFIVDAPRPLTNRQLWRLVVDELAGQVAHAQDHSWLGQAALIGEVDGRLIVGAPSRFARDLLERRFAEPIARAIATALGSPRSISFVVTQEWRPPTAGPTLDRLG